MARHGQTEWTISRQHTSRTDLPLTEQGQREALALGERLAGLDLDEVLTSPFARAAETARLAGFAHAERDERLREWEYGDYEGRTTADIRSERPGWDLWRDGCPGGECAADVAARLAPLLDDLRTRAHTRVLLFAHGHSLRVLAATWLGLDPRVGALLALEPGSLSVLGSEHARAAIARWNVPARDRHSRRT